ncbi:MAG: xanthine dehydrogenase family protein molybdopterin-binding subunit [Methylocystaceae bacterium]
MKLDVVGTNAIRVDGRAKLTGQAIYPEDIYLDGMLHGKTLRSSRPHALITVDVTTAEAMPGVVKVFTAKDVPGHNAHGVLFKDQEVLCSLKVRRIGDPIAFVVATEAKIAEAALQLIRVDYQDLPALFDAEEAMKDKILIHENQSNTIYHYKLRTGDVEAGFAQCDAIVENVYRTAMVDHAFLQPEAGVAYLEADGTIVVCAATQYPHFDQVEISESLGVPKERVKYINPAIGGAFGGREDITVQIHLAMAALATGKPVKTVYSREESFYAHAKRHSEVIHIKTGADRDGKLIAMEAKIIGDSGAYTSWAVNVLRKSGVHITGPYVIPNVKVDSYAVYTNNPFTGAMRGFGAAQVPVAHEQQMDMLAEQLGISPVTIRVINAFRVGSRTATGQLLAEGVPLVTCIEKVAAAMNLLPGGAEG